MEFISHNWKVAVYPYDSSNSSSYTPGVHISLVVTGLFNGSSLHAPGAHAKMDWSNLQMASAMRPHGT